MRPANAVRRTGLALLMFAGVLGSAVKAAGWNARPTLWYRGNTHTHTLNSDGDAAPDVVARWYREHGYQFVFITDHDYLTDVAPLNALLAADDQFLVLPGQEVTQWSDDPTRVKSRASDVIGAPAHLNALFATRLIEPIGERRCAHRACGGTAPPSMPIGKTFRPNIEAIQADDGIAQINHPNALWSLTPQDLADIPNGTLLEIWNAGDPNNLGGDDGAGNVSPSAEGFWDGLLSRGRILWGTAADDSHRYRSAAFLDASATDPTPLLPGRAWIMVRADALTAEDLKRAIAQGHFYASVGVTLKEISRDSGELRITVLPPKAPGPGGPPPRFRTEFIGKDGVVLASVGGLEARYRFTGSEAYVRAVVTDGMGRKAWTQPVFLDGRKAQSPYGRP